MHPIPGDVVHTGRRNGRVGCFLGRVGLRQGAGSSCDSGGIVG